MRGLAPEHLDWHSVAECRFRPDFTSGGALGCAESDTNRQATVWVEHSRRYTNPDSYLIQLPEWLSKRPKAIRQTGTPEHRRAQLEERIRCRCCAPAPCTTEYTSRRASPREA